MKPRHRKRASNYNDNDSDELAHEHVLTTALNKELLASQPSISRFYSRMDETTIKQLNCILTELRRMAYAIKRPEFIVFDLDSTLLKLCSNCIHKKEFIETFINIQQLYVQLNE